MKKITSIIFDLDGTLVDSKLNFNKMRQEIGIPKNEAILEYVEKSNDEIFRKFAFEIIHQHELNGARVATALRDVSNFINLMSSKKMPKAIVTRNSKEVTELTLSKFDWIFDRIITRDCAPAKPKPDAIIKIAKELNLSLESTLYIGDHKFDIETAENAGCIKGLILHEYNQELKEHVDYAIHDFKELIPYLAF